MRRALLLLALAACGGPDSAPAGDAPLVHWETECDTVYRLSDRFAACEKAEAEMRQSATENTNNLKTNLGQVNKAALRPEEKQELAGQCRGYANQLREGLAHFGC